MNFLKLMSDYRQTTRGLNLERLPRNARNQILMRELTKRATGSGSEVAHGITEFETIRPDQIAAEADKVGRIQVLAGWLRAAFELIINGDFAPNAVRQAARSITDDFRNAYGYQPNYADITEAIKVSHLRGDLKVFRPGDLQRAADFMLSELRARLGAKIEDATLEIKSNFSNRNFWDRVRAMAAGGPPQIERSAGEVLRAFGLPSADYQMNPHRGWSIRETVRASVGAPVNPKTRMRDIVRPGLDRLPKAATKEKLTAMIGDATRGLMGERSVSLNLEKSPPISTIKKPNGMVLYKVGSATFQTYDDAQRYIQAISNNADMLPPRKV